MTENERKIHGVLGARTLCGKDISTMLRNTVRPREQLLTDNRQEITCRVCLLKGGR